MVRKETCRDRHRVTDHCSGLSSKPVQREKKQMTIDFVLVAVSVSEDFICWSPRVETSNHYGRSRTTLHPIFQNWIQPVYFQDALETVFIYYNWRTFNTTCTWGPLYSSCLLWNFNFRFIHLTSFGSLFVLRLGHSQFSSFYIDTAENRWVLTDIRKH